MKKLVMLFANREVGCDEDSGEDLYACMIRKLQMEESEARQNKEKEETRKATFGSKQGLQVIVDKHSNLDSVGTIFGNDNGFKVYIGQPSSFPMLTNDRLTLSTGKDKKIRYHLG